MLIISDDTKPSAAILKPYKVPSVDEWTLLFTQLLPGAHVAVIASEVPYHRTVVNLEDAGFEIRDQIVWIDSEIVPIALARKPVEGTVTENVLKYETGGLNVDGCRIKTKEDLTRKCLGIASAVGEAWKRPWHELAVLETFGSLNGRWPANLILTKQAGKLLDEQTEAICHKPGNTNSSSLTAYSLYKGGWNSTIRNPDYHASMDNQTGASRFFKCCDSEKELITYLQRLITSK